MSWGATFVENLNALTINGLELQSVASFDSLNGDSPIYYALPVADNNNNNNNNNNCTTLNGVDKGVNLSHKGTGFLEIDLIANVDNANLEVYLGSEGQWLPTSSTNDIGNGDKIDVFISTGSANQLQTYYVNFEALNSAVWNAWAGKSKIQSIGFVSGTAGAKFTVKEVRIGTATKLTPDSCNYLRANYDIVQSLGCQNNPAIIKAKGLRGAGKYTFNWSDVLNTVNDSTIEVDTSGFYSLIVSDVNCSDTVSVHVPSRPTKNTNVIEAFFFNGEFRTGFTRANSFLLKNKGCVSTDGELYVILDSLVTFEQGEGSPDRISGDTLFWDFNNLQFGNPDLFSSCSLKTSLSSAIGDTVCFEVGVKFSNAFNVDTVLKKYFCFPIINGYDPNDITVHPSSCIKGYVLNSDVLTYKIRFQNTGNAEAININVMDTLDPNVDASTFELISSSHPTVLKTFLLGDSIMHFAFDEIWLKDSLNHEPESYGYVVYQVKQKLNLPEGTKILNKADIYFDYNPAVVTNTVISTVTENIPICNPRTSSTANETYKLSGSIYPNPNDGTFTISFSEVISSGVLKLFNIQGELVDTQLIKNSDAILVSKKLKSGVYFIKMSSSEGISNGKLVVR